MDGSLHYFSHSNFFPPLQSTEREGGVITVTGYGTQMEILGFLVKSQYQCNGACGGCGAFASVA